MYVDKYTITCTDYGLKREQGGGLSHSAMSLKSYCIPGCIITN